MKHNFEHHFRKGDFSSFGFFKVGVAVAKTKPAYRMGWCAKMRSGTVILFDWFGFVQFVCAVGSFNLEMCMG